MERKVALLSLKLFINHMWRRRYMLVSLCMVHFILMNGEEKEKLKQSDCIYVCYSDMTEWHCSCCCRFHGISWNREETLIAYIAEAPPQPRPAFNDCGYRKENSSEEDCNTWKGQGDWEEDWGERYSKKGRPSLFVLDIARYVPRILISTAVYRC